mmetsp:Transcript_15685/g.37821  ORF Transcript_15685/g.37821 Transcript_15685/m.37821 type:complete len:537 (-) Transcript_15685:67-1677(-)
MAFSGAVKLGDLDDFINPSQDCIVPLMTVGKDGGAVNIENDVGDALVARREVIAKPTAAKPEAKPDVKPDLIKSKEGDKAQISLSDCLACSGCVTSAETILLQDHSTTEFVRRAREAEATVVTISPATRTDLAAYYGLEPMDALRRLTTVLARFNVTFVVDGTVAEAISLVEAKREFLRRRQEGKLPVLTSHCPGWTCYAEKVVDQKIIPHLSSVRSPQQIQGQLAKTQLLATLNMRRHRAAMALATDPSISALRPWGERLGAAPVARGKVYHVSVQPCFDKKLEAARGEYTHSFGTTEEGIPEVDTVLATGEIQDLLQQEGIDLRAVEPWAVDCGGVGGTLLSCHDGLNTPTADAGSGGFLEYVFRAAAAETLGPEAAAAPLKFTQKQNEDMREVVLESEGKVVMKFVAAYGFRNVQNIIRRIKKGQTTGKVDFDYAEVMACPGGCLNGGGQIRGDDDEDRGPRMKRLEGVLHDTATVVAPDRHPWLKAAVSVLDAAWKISSDVLATPRWAAVHYKSIKVDEEGNEVAQASSLKW